MKRTFREYLLCELDNTESQIQQLKTKQFMAMKKKNDQGSIADRDIGNLQKQISTLSLKQVADQKTAEQKAKGEKTPTETPSGTETTQKMAPSARIGFGTSSI